MNDFEAFYSDWMQHCDSPPSVCDFSDDKKERAAFRYWAKKNGLPLKRPVQENARKYKTFYDDWMLEHSRPPSASDYGENHRGFARWAQKTGRPLTEPPRKFDLIELANRVEPLRDAGLETYEIASRLGLTYCTVHKALYILSDSENTEDDPRACEPEYVKKLCDELRRRDLIPPKLLPEEWSRYLDIRQKRLNDGTYGIILPEDE